MEKNLFWIGPIITGTTLLCSSFIIASTNSENPWDFVRHLVIWFVAASGGILLYRGLMFRKSAKK